MPTHRMGVPTSARLWPQEQLDELFSESFPPFITADRVVSQYIGRVRECFSHLDLTLIDEADVPIAAGWAVPIDWDQSIEDLPEGYTQSLVRAVENHEQDVAVNTLVICGGVVRPDRKGHGVAGQLIAALRNLAEQQSLRHVLAPIRPTLKARYPLISIESYMTWRREDGSPFDPWLRTHCRIGGWIVAPAPRSQTMTGTVAAWEGWTDMRFPVTGDYVIPDGLSTLHIDVAQDVGRYVEPNIWVRHA